MTTRKRGKNYKSLEICFVLNFLVKALDVYAERIIVVISNVFSHKKFSVYLFIFFLTAILTKFRCKLLPPLTTQNEYV